MLECWMIESARIDREAMLRLSQIKHVWQLPDSCGSACVSMVLKTLGGKSVDQEQIHNEIYDPEWEGTKPQSIEKYLNEHGAKAELLTDQSLKDAKKLIDDGFLLIILIFDDFPTKDDDPPFGHYVILQDVNFENNEATLIDPSNALRFYDKDGFVVLNKGKDHEAKKRPSYKIKVKDLQERWHDEVEPGKQGYGYCISVNASEIV